MRNISILLSLLFSLFTVNVLAQKHDYMWALGVGGEFTEYQFFLDFKPSDHTGVVIRPDTMSNGYYTSSYCDANGNILFYTNGIWILNKSGELVENSMGLNPTLPDWQSYYYRGGQSGFFLAKPGDSTILYFISLDFGLHPAHLWPYIYVGQNLMVATIDLTANNGAGKVIQKNQILLTGTLMAPAACRHANGRDWWLMIGDNTIDTGGCWCRMQIRINTTAFCLVQRVSQCHKAKTLVLSRVPSEAMVRIIILSVTVFQPVGNTMLIATTIWALVFFLLIAVAACSPLNDGLITHHLLPSIPIIIGINLVQVLSFQQMIVFFIKQLHILRLLLMPFHWVLFHTFCSTIYH